MIEAMPDATDSLMANIEERDRELAQLRTELADTKERLDSALSSVRALAADNPTSNKFVKAVANRWCLFVDEAFGMAYAVVDLNYVLEGLPIRLGVDLRPFWVGKLMKPAGWTPPDIEGELKRQGWVP